MAGLNAQLSPKGFGSYLTGILPADIATACGAFSSTLLQVKNIQQLPVEKFAQVVANMETTKGLAINGTSVPVDTGLAKAALAATAMGNGPYMTYTMSNFLGTMSGLPYNADLKTTQELINALATPALKTIYRENYLAVTWQPATVSVQYASYVVGGDTYYTVTGLTISSAGGGYGREGAPAPTVTISNGGSGATTIGIDDTDLSTFGRVRSVTLTSSGTDGTTIPTATISTPPGPGWPGMNSVIQTYINSANQEILNIKEANPTLSINLNKAYDNTGIQLSYEQRARTIGLSKLPPQFPTATRDTNYADSPTAQFSFVDALYTYGLNAQPHMYAQTIEAIANQQTAGGQSIIGLMRESRNQSRLTEIGISLDNTIPDKLSKKEQSILLATGSLPLSGTTVTPTATLVTVDSAGFVVGPDTGIPSDGNIIPPQPLVPGALSASPWGELIPPNLNASLSAKTLLPSVYNVTQAIDEVVRCNCDCWNNL